MTKDQTNKILDFFMNDGLVFYKVISKTENGIFRVNDIEEDPHQGTIAEVETEYSRDCIVLMEEEYNRFTFYKKVDL